MGSYFIQQHYRIRDIPFMAKKMPLPFHTVLISLISPKWLFAKKYITGSSFFLLPPWAKAVSVSQQSENCCLHLQFLFSFSFFVFFFFSFSVYVLANSTCIINSNSTCQARCFAALALCFFRTASPEEWLYELLVTSTEMATDIPIPSFLCIIHKAVDLSW